MPYVGVASHRKSKLYILRMSKQCPLLSLGIDLGELLLWRGVGGPRRNRGGGEGRGKQSQTEQARGLGDRHWVLWSEHLCPSKILTPRGLQLEGDTLGGDLGMRMESLCMELVPLEKRLCAVPWPHLTGEDKATRQYLESPYQTLNLWAL